MNDDPRATATMARLRELTLAQLGTLEPIEAIIIEEYGDLYREFSDLAAAFRKQNDGLAKALMFSRSVIKSSEGWSDRCKDVIEGALRGHFEGADDDPLK